MSRKKLEEYTSHDIKEFKRDIEKYQKTQRLFLILGFVFAALFIVSVFATVFLGILTYINLRDHEYYAAQYLFILFDSVVGSLAFIFCFAFVAMFIVRSAAFNGKIENRRRIIEDWDELQEKRIDIKEESKEPIEVKAEEKPEVIENKSDIEEL